MGLSAANYNDAAILTAWTPPEDRLAIGGSAPALTIAGRNARRSARLYAWVVEFRSTEAAKRFGEQPTARVNAVLNALVD